MLIDRVSGIHGSFSPVAAHAFHRGPNDPFFCPIDIWRIENGCEYPTINTQELIDEELLSGQQLDNNSGKFELSRQTAKGGISEEAGSSYVPESPAQIENLGQAHTERINSERSPSTKKTTEKESLLPKRTKLPSLKRVTFSTRIKTKAP